MKQHLPVIQPAIKEEIALHVADSTPLLERMGVQPAVFERHALNALIRRPDLLEPDIDTHSLMLAILACAQSGLVPDGRHAALVPIEGKVALWPMVDGRLMLARAATPGLEVWSKAVYADDIFEWEEGTDLRIRHVPSLMDTDRRTWPDLKAVYSMASAPDWRRDQCVVLARSEINEFMEHSPAKKGPWATWPVEMAMVRATNRLLKRLPSAGNIIDQPGDYIVDLDPGTQTQTVALAADRGAPGISDALERGQAAAMAAASTAPAEPAAEEPAAPQPMF